MNAVTTQHWLQAASRVPRILQDAKRHPGTRDVAERYVKRVLEIAPFSQEETRRLIGSLPAGYTVLLSVLHDRLVLMQVTTNDKGKTQQRVV